MPAQHLDEHQLGQSQANAGAARAPRLVQRGQREVHEVAHAVGRRAGAAPVHQPRQRREYGVERSQVAAEETADEGRARRAGTLAHRRRQLPDAATKGPR
jgi:hypothetical protein